MLICEEANRESFRREGPLSGPPGNPIDKQSGEQLRSHICGSTFLPRRPKRNYYQGKNENPEDGKASMLMEPPPGNPTLNVTQTAGEVGPPGNVLAPVLIVDRGATSTVVSRSWFESICAWLTSPRPPPTRPFDLVTATPYGASGNHSFPVALMGGGATRLPILLRPPVSRSFPTIPFGKGCPPGPETKTPCTPANPDARSPSS